MGRALVLFTCCTSAFALNPDLDVSQYAHKSWTVREGFFKSAINGIAQTPDGYLWLGTQFGLLRFDGVKTSDWNPPPGQHLPSNDVRGLLAARDGTLWIGTTKGLASWKGGKLTQYPDLAGQGVFRIVEDREGSVWASGVGAPSGRLCEIKTGSVQCHGDDGRLGRGVVGLYEDSKGNLWAGVENGLWRWRPGPPKFYPLPGELDSVQGFAEGDDGSLLLGMHSGLRQVVQGKLESYLLSDSVRVNGRKMLRDREGSLWVATEDRALVHVHQGRTDVFAVADGLSDENVINFFEDREGNIWVATNGGLDRFHDVAAATFSMGQGLSNTSISPLLADRDGSVWFSTRSGLNRWKNGQITIYQRRGSHLPARAAQKIFSNVLPDFASSLYQDERGRIWVATHGGFGYLENDRFIPMSGVPARNVFTFARDTAENLWIAEYDLGLLRLSRENAIQQIPWATLGPKDFALTLAADPVQGGLWLGFSQGGVAYFKDGQIRESYAAREGLGDGRVTHMRTDRDGTLWASTEGGLSRLKNGHVSTLSSKNGLPCDTVHWSLEDADGTLWLYMPCGLIRIARSELDAWATDAKKTINATVFDSADGVGATASIGAYSPGASKSPDGKLWLVSPGGASVVDPRHLPFNKLPPPVHIESVKVNGKELAAADGIALSHSANDLEIDYTALSFTNPDRVRFRYKLEGKDRNWQDVGTRRQAYYGGLAPRNYRFRVMASNNDGVWNEAGAALNFNIVPAYYQTIWFEGLCVLASAALLWLLYRLRLRQETARVNLLYTERLAERTRIARDLHDTLLQSLAGVSLQLDGIAKQAVTAPEKTPSLIARVREQVDSAFREARVKVWNLRSPDLQVFGLEASLRQLSERIGAGTTAGCDLTVSGQPRPVEPDMEEELLRIAQEAANNASRHAEPAAIRIALDYGERSLMLAISDDGRGFDFEEGMRKSGHWGLKNMQERAAQIGGTCKITTAVGQGTRIEIRVPLAPAWSLRNTSMKRAQRNAAGDAS